MACFGGLPTSNVVYRKYTCIDLDPISPPAPAQIFTELVDGSKGEMYVGPFAERPLRETFLWAGIETSVKEIIP